MAIQELRAERDANNTEYVASKIIEGGAIRYWSIAVKSGKE